MNRLLDAILGMPTYEIVVGALVLSAIYLLMLFVVCGLAGFNDKKGRK